MAQLEELRERLAVLNGQAQDVRKGAEDERRDFTAEEAAKLDGLLDAADRCKQDIDRLERLNQQTDLLVNARGRKTEPDQPAHLDDDGEGNVMLARVQPRGRRDTIPAVYARTPPNWNYSSLGEFALDVRKAGVGGGLSGKLQLVEKLAAATTYGSEGVGADGGFAVPPEFRNAIMQLVTGDGSLLSRCDQVTCTGNTFTVPVDETTPWQTSGGILANWEGEATAATQSKPQLQDRTIKLNKLRCLVPLTEEIIEDASAMDSYLRRKAPDKISFKATYGIVQGTGVGMPLGLLNSSAKVTVSKESGQVTGTLIALNVMKMYNRMYADWRGQAVWLYNPEIEPQLFKLSVPGTDNTGNFATAWGFGLFMPPGGVSGAPYGTIFGRPAIPTQACNALSTEGDIIFVALSQYLSLLKGGPNPRTDTSIHLWFDQDITAYKFVLRMGGMPWLSTPISPLAGSNSYSSIVTLQSR